MKCSMMNHPRNRWENYFVYRKAQLFSQENLQTFISFLARSPIAQASRIFSQRCVELMDINKNREVHLGRFRIHVRKEETEKIGTISFHFQLVLSRVYDKLDENLIARWSMQSKSKSHVLKFCESC